MSLTAWLKNLPIIRTYVAVNILRERVRLLEEWRQNAITKMLNQSQEILEQIALNEDLKKKILELRKKNRGKNSRRSSQ
jgi:predicted Holliday junction resolvase-like endonuclease